MRITTCLFVAMEVSLLLSHGAPAVGADPGAAASSAPADKWHYHLFDPVPSDQLRGMDTDRPNKTNTPHTIDAGHLQMETGFIDYAYDRNRYKGADSRSDAWNFGQFNFRMGVLNDLELNAVVNSYTLLREDDYAGHQIAHPSGFGDITVGGKLNLWGNESGDGAWETALAIQPQFKIPTAGHLLGNDHPELFIGVPLLVNLPAGFHLGLQTTLSWERNSDNRGDVLGWQNSASVDRVLIGKLDVYLEYWSHVSPERHLEAQQTLDVGATYPVTDNLALDTGVNFGLNHASNTVEWLVGVSIRF